LDIKLQTKGSASVITDEPVQLSSNSGGLLSLLPELPCAILIAIVLED
jgi:hypothetical protein